MPDTDTAQVIADVMDRWQAGIDTHEPQHVAALFAEDAIFQGLRPYSVGRQGVTEYYDSQPRGMTVSYRIQESRRVAADAVLGYLRADFSFPDQTVISVNIGVLIKQVDGDWGIAYYQASRVS